MENTRIKYKSNKESLYSELVMEYKRVRQNIRKCCKYKEMLILLSWHNDFVAMQLQRWLGVPEIMGKVWR